MSFGRLWRAKGEAVAAAARLAGQVPGSVGCGRTSSLRRLAFPASDDLHSANCPDREGTHLQVNSLFCWHHPGRDTRITDAGQRRPRALLGTIADGAACSVFSHRSCRRRSPATSRMAARLRRPWRSDPHQHLAIPANFEQEARLWRFDGPNQLGLLTNLATLRLSLNKQLGRAELGLQVGALSDWQKRFATAELGARIGFHRPFLPGVKAFAECAEGIPSMARFDF